MASSTPTGTASVPVAESMGVFMRDGRYVIVFEGNAYNGRYSEMIPISTAHIDFSSRDLGIAIGLEIHGNANPNSIVGSDGDDLIYGGDGMDTIEGGPGNDRIYGEGDTDFLSDYASNDADYIEPGPGGALVNTNDGDTNDEMNLAGMDTSNYGLGYDAGDKC